MKLELYEHKGLKFMCRKGTSDYKAYKEVILNNSYQRKDFKINAKEKWIDLGGNVGAFTVLAASKGAKVEVYEPDPFSCKMIEKNIKLNNLDANIHQKAIVDNDLKHMVMYVGNNMNVWRNSLYKNWGNNKFKVSCINYKEVIDKNACVKMDIEGAEMGIIEDMKIYPKKFVFEWSFDIDKNLNRYRKAYDRMKNKYTYFKGGKGFYDMVDDVLPSHIFPPCTTIFCQS